MCMYASSVSLLCLDLFSSVIDHLKTGDFMKRWKVWTNTLIIAWGKLKFYFILTPHFAHGN